MYCLILSVSREFGGGLAGWYWWGVGSHEGTAKVSGTPRSSEAWLKLTHRAVVSYHDGLLVTWQLVVLRKNDQRKRETEEEEDKLVVGGGGDEKGGNERRGRKGKPVTRIEPAASCILPNVRSGLSLLLQSIGCIDQSQYNVGGDQEMRITGDRLRGWLPHALPQEAPGAAAPLKRRSHPDTEPGRGNRSLTLESTKERPRDDGDGKPQHGSPTADTQDNQSRLSRRTKSSRKDASKPKTKTNSLNTLREAFPFCQNLRRCYGQLHREVNTFIHLFFF